MRIAQIGLVLALLAPSAIFAQEPLTVARTTLIEWKAVFGRIEARNTVPARSRIGGTLTSVDVEEGDAVEQGQVLALIDDAKLALQMQSVDAQIDALASQLDNARTELERGEGLLERGVTTAQRLDALRTQVNVLINQIEATRAQKRVIEQQTAEGAVLAPISGKVISVPVTAGSVVMPGEPVATIGGGGFFLRLAVPERHAGFLTEGIEIMIGEDGQARSGRLAKVYPAIENGRVIADVEVADLNSDFVGARVPVRLPVGETRAILVPKDRIETRMGLDFVSVQTGASDELRAVVPGETRLIEGKPMVEILSGLTEGDVLGATHD